MLTENEILMNQARKFQASAMRKLVRAQRTTDPAFRALHLSQALVNASWAMARLPGDVTTTDEGNLLWNLCFGTQWFIQRLVMEVMEANFKVPVKACEGCDEQVETRTYKCTFKGLPGEQNVCYCDECAELAYANFNGETLSIWRV